MTYDASRGASRSAEELGQNLYKRVAVLEQENKGLKALSKERAEFILNGVEAEYISMPEIEEDPAHDIYRRCQLTDEYAMKSLKRQKQELPARQDVYRKG